MCVRVCLCVRVREGGRETERQKELEDIEKKMGDQMK